MYIVQYHSVQFRFFMDPDPDFSDPDSVLIRIRTQEKKADPDPEKSPDSKHWFVPYYLEVNEKPTGSQGKKPGIDNLQTVILNGYNYRYVDVRFGPGSESALRFIAGSGSAKN